MIQISGEALFGIYQDLQKFVVTLDPDPVTRGPLYLMERIATTRDYLNSVEVHLQRVHQAKHWVMTGISDARLNIDVETDRLYSDPRVKPLPAVADRQAAIRVILGDAYANLRALEKQLQDLEMVEKAIKTQHKSLTETMSAIRLQRSLIQGELSTKSFYGGSNAGELEDKGSSIPVGEEPIWSGNLEDDIDQLLPVAQSQPEPVPQPEPQPQPQKVEIVVTSSEPLVVQTIPGLPRSTLPPIKKDSTILLPRDFDPDDLLEEAVTPAPQDVVVPPQAEPKSEEESDIMDFLDLV